MYLFVTYLKHIGSSLHKPNINLLFVGFQKFAKLSYLLPSPSTTKKLVNICHILAILKYWILQNYIDFQDKLQNSFITFILEISNFRLYLNFFSDERLQADSEVASPWSVWYGTFACLDWEPRSKWLWSKNDFLLMKTYDSVVKS